MILSPTSSQCKEERVMYIFTSMLGKDFHFLTNEKMNENQTLISQTYIPILFYRCTIIKEVKIWRAILSEGIRGNMQLAAL